ncbi:hypothetical protein GF327_07940 [Candidatus Woesearchaeota archaeon]|nr:hypothetical protein [Candidatus Woesearchaeota archaeon]
MKLSKTEIITISELGKGNNSVPELANALKKSISQVYRIAKKLEKKEIAKLSDNSIKPESKTHVTMMLNLLAKAPNLSNPFSGTGIEIYKTIINPKTGSEIIKKTGLHKTTIFKKIRQGKKMSLILKKNKKYRINEKIWQDAKEFLIELKKYEESLDQRVPVNSTIYHKNEKEIVFSNKNDIDAQKTAFSAYEKYSIKLLLVTNYYYLPKKQLTKKEIFMHSLYIVEKDFSIKNIIFIALFYAKYKKEFSKIKHEIMDKLNKVFSGKEIKNYPTLEEIKDRAKVYDIKIK